jgi:hypothetical protein
MRQRKWDAALKAIDDLEKKPGQAIAAQPARRLCRQGHTAAARRASNAPPAGTDRFCRRRGLARLDLADKKPGDARKRFEG